MKKQMKTDECIDAETLAAWSDGALPADEARAVELHLSNCARCQAMMAVFAKTEPALPESVPFWRRWPVGWLVPLTAAAAAVALVIWVGSAIRPPVPVDSVARTEPQPAQVAPAPAPTTTVPVTPPPPAAAPVIPPSPPAAAKAAPDAPPSPAAPPAPRSLPESVTASAASPVAQASRAASALAADRVFLAAIEIVSPAPVAFQAGTANAARAPGGRGGAVAGGVAGGLAGGAAAATPTRWRILQSGSVERSLTGGASWEQIATYAPGAITSGAAPSASVCWLIGRDGLVLLAVDDRVDRVSFPTTTDLASVRATDARQATVTTTDGRIFSTTDGGASWR